MPTSDPGKPLLVTQWGRALKRRPPKRIAKPVTLQMHNMRWPKGLRESTKLALNQRTRPHPAECADTARRPAFLPPDIKSMSLSRKHRSTAQRKREAAADCTTILASPRCCQAGAEPAVRRRSSTGGCRQRALRPTTSSSGRALHLLRTRRSPGAPPARSETEAGWGSGVNDRPAPHDDGEPRGRWKPGTPAAGSSFTPLKVRQQRTLRPCLRDAGLLVDKADGSDGLTSPKGAFDYVVCVLDSPSRQRHGLDGIARLRHRLGRGDYWGHIGLSQDLSGGPPGPPSSGYQDFISESRPS